MRSPSRALLSLLLCAVFLPAAPARAQQPDTPLPADEPAPPNAEGTEGAAEAQTPAPAPGDPGTVEPQEEAPRPASERSLPQLDVYFPEGELDLRVNRLINEVFFEGQVKYNFIEGDITAFLRYRYYGNKRTTQFTVFDSIEFDDIDEDVKSEFDRVRGTLMLFQWPYNYNHRSFFLAELDRISSNRQDEGDRLLRTGDTNTFIRLGYQLGTPDEGRSSAIAGETRARSQRLFSAFREFGPGAATLTAALTYGFEIQDLSDFNYLKGELEGAKRFDLSDRSFLIGRLRGGTFIHAGRIDPAPEEPRSPLDLYDIPQSEFLSVDGRADLKGIDAPSGTDVVLTTWEFFFPWFLEEQRDFLRLEWQNWYWVLYAGAGNVGFDRDIYTDFSNYLVDAGLGFESSFRLRRYRFFISAIVAQALKGDGSVEARVSLKSYR